MQALFALVTRFALLLAVFGGGAYLWDRYHGFPWAYVAFGIFALYLIYLEMRDAQLSGRDADRTPKEPGER